MAAESDNRQIQMTVDLGGEQVVVERARFVDELGKPFMLHVDIIATLGEVDLLPHLGKPVAVHLYEDDELMRHFHGLITGGDFIQEGSDGYHYRLDAQPFTYFLAQNRDMAIFQDLTAPDIIKKVLGNANVSDFRLKLTKSYRPRVYCVQYRESDLTFITRLMEEEGIYYYWEHHADKHVMVLCDAPTAHEPGKPVSLPFTTTASSIMRVGSTQRGGADHFIESWGERVRSAGQSLVTMRAYDFTRSDRIVQADASDAGQHPGDAREIYSYPNRFTNEAAGAEQSRAQLSTQRRDRLTYSGRTQATGLATGYKLGLTKHPSARLNQQYLVIRTEHVLQAEQYRSEQAPLEEQEDEPTRVTIEAIPAGTPFSLPQSTPKPIVQGLETAAVSGPAGEEIYTDEYGRVKVRFHWDRAGTAGEKSTCWIRVAQFGGLGNILLPRIGEEVMVDFLHGNPDEPIVMGSVFNSTHMPVYPLPANKTRALWRTKSYMGGRSTSHAGAIALDSGNPGANEIRFEDKGGQEEFYIHAEKDLNARVRNDETFQVGRDEATLVGRDRTDEVKRDEKTTIGHDQTLVVVNDQREGIGGSRTVGINGSDTLDIDGTLSVHADGTIVINSETSITLKVMGSTIVINAEGISIDAPHVKMKGGRSAIVTSGRTTIEGTGGNRITGNTVSIN